MELFSQNQATVWQNWLASFGLYRKAFSKTWFLGIASVAIVIAPVLFGTIYQRVGDHSLQKMVGAILIPLAIALTTTYLASLILAQVYSVGSEQNWSLRDLRSLVNKRYLKIIGSMLTVFCLIFFGGVLLLSKYTAALGFFIIFFVFGLFSMVHPLVLLDNCGVFGSLKETCVLVWGKWWRTFVLVFPLPLINALLTAVTAYAHTWSNWLVVGFILLFVSLIYPLFYAGILVAFNDLKVRKKLA